MKSPIPITKAIEFKNVLVLYTGMSLMLCAHSLYCDMSQLIVLFAFGNVSGLSKLQTFIIYYKKVSEYEPDPMVYVVGDRKNRLNDTII